MDGVLRVLRTAFAARLVLSAAVSTTPGIAQQPLAMPLPCPPRLDQALDAVKANQLDIAEQQLTAALRDCPSESLIRRELAAVRFKQGRYQDATRLVSDYLDQVPGDSLAWQLLASSRYLDGDSHGALQAWNRIGHPLVDSLRIDGTRGGNKRLVRAVAIRERTLLTSTRLTLAQRRLTDLPSVERARLSYRVNLDGSVEVHAFARERPIVDPAWRLAAATAAHALAAETVRLEVTNLVGAGEHLVAEWRWETARPRRALHVELPAWFGIPGVLSLEGAWERVRVTVGTVSEAVLEDTWHEATVAFGAWLSPSLRQSVSLGVERWNGDRGYLSMSMTSELRAAADRLKVGASLQGAAALNRHPGYRTAVIRAMWASSLDLRRPTWSARVGGNWASSNAPLGAWPLVTRSLTRGIPLRAEPSIDGDAMQGRATGRAIVHAGVSADHPIANVGPLAFGLGVFVDAARLSKSATGTVGTQDNLDAGIGVRVGIAGGELGFLRADLAWGLLTSRRAEISVGFHQNWPPWTLEPR